MIHVVFDIETLSTKVDAVVLEIGMAAFKEGSRHVHSFRVGLAMDPQLQAGRRVDSGALRFWASMPEVFQDVLHDVERLETARRSLDDKLADALAKLIYDTDYPSESQLLETFLLPPSDVRYWCRGPHFDAAILEHFFDQFDWKCPWKYNQIRDIRTFMDGRERQFDHDAQGLTPHRAEDDARIDAQDLQYYLELEAE